MMHLLRRRNPLRFGNPGHILLVRQGSLHALEEVRNEFMRDLGLLEKYRRDHGWLPKGYAARRDELREKLTEIEEEITIARISVEAIRAEACSHIQLLPKRNSTSASSADPQTTLW